MNQENQYFTCISYSAKPRTDVNVDWTYTRFDKNCKFEASSRIAPAAMAEAKAIIDPCFSFEAILFGPDFEVETAALGPEAAMGVFLLAYNADVTAEQLRKEKADSEKKVAELEEKLKQMQLQQEVVASSNSAPLLHKRPRIEGNPWDASSASPSTSLLQGTLPKMAASESEQEPQQRQRSPLATAAAGYPASNEAWMSRLQKAVKDMEEFVAQGAESTAQLPTAAAQLNSVAAGSILTVYEMERSARAISPSPMTEASSEEEGEKKQEKQCLRRS